MEAFAGAFEGAAFAGAERDGGREASEVAVVSAAAAAGAVSSPPSSPLSLSEPEPSSSSFCISISHECRVIKNGECHSLVHGMSKVIIIS